MCHWRYFSVFLYLLLARIVIELNMQAACKQLSFYGRDARLSCAFHVVFAALIEFNEATKHKTHTKFVFIAMCTAQFNFALLCQHMRSRLNKLMVVVLSVLNFGFILRNNK
jgi:hypothetical protein